MTINKKLIIVFLITTVCFVSACSNKSATQENFMPTLTISVIGENGSLVSHEADKKYSYEAGTIVTIEVMVEEGYHTGEDLMVVM